MNKIVTFQIDNSIINQLNKIAKVNDRSQSAQLRIIIKEFLEKQSNNTQE